MLNLIGQLMGEVAINGKDSLRGGVASLVLENAYDNTDSAVVDFMEDVMQYGCVSGCVTGMIYYHETVKFYDEYREYIYDLMLDLGMDEELERMGLISDCENDEEMEELYDIHADGEKNRLAWMAFEIITGELYNDFELLAM
jgi:hypothetical protein